MTTRPATPADYNDVVRLVRHLGAHFPIDGAALPIVFRELLSDPDWEAYVAEGDDGRVVGLVSIRFANALHASGMLAAIEELVVDAAAQGRGVGRLLCERAVARARERDCRKVVVTSNRAETDPAGFYASVGFESVAGSYAIFLDARPA
jgi:ribosomal protein S18 acetylase RimI-like enzyme